MSSSMLPAPGTESSSIPTAGALPPISNRNQPGTVWLNRLECAAVALLALLVTALHVRFATNVGEMWRVLDYDSFPMLFFAVLRGWTAIFGADDDLALRVLGLITGLGILGTLW